MNCQFDIYFRPACDVIFSLSKIDLSATNSIRFRIINGSFVFIGKKHCFQMGIVDKPHRSLWLIY